MLKDKKSKTAKPFLVFDGRFWFHFCGRTITNAENGGKVHRGLRNWIDSGAKGLLDDLIRANLHFLFVSANAIC